MANTKIDRIKLNGSDTVYDIDLPSDATPSISSLTVSGIKNAAMVSTDANGKLTKSNLPAAFEQISIVDKTIQYNDNIEVTEVYLSCEGMESHYKWDRLVFSAPGSPAASNIKYYYNYMGQKTELTPTNASALNSVLDSYGESIVVAINRDESNPTITYLPNSLVLGRGYYSNKDGGDVFTYYVYDSPQGSMPALREIAPETHFTTGLYVGKADEKSNSATTNGNTYLKLFDDDTKRAQHLINGGGATIVTSNASGTIEIATPIKTLDTTSGSGLGDGRSENIAGSGTIYLHKVAKTGKLTDLSERTFSNISSRGEEYLEWGGPSHRGIVSPIGMSLSAEHSANRVALINPKALLFEYSSDGGATWTQYPYATDDNTKSKFCTTSLALPIGRPNSSTNLIANKSKTRITITAQDGTTGYVYTSLKKMLLQVSTPTTLSMLIERRKGTDYKNNGAWQSIGTYDVSGWTGWNDIPINFALGGSSGQTANYWQMRLTITCTTVDSSFPKIGEVDALRLFGDNCWTPASTLGETGHLYSYNMAGHATFPGNVYANGFYATGTISTTDGSVSGLSFIEGGKKLSEKYLAKGSASTNDNQVVYNPVELKKGLTGTGAFVWNGNYVDTFKVNVLSSGSITEVFKLSQLTATLKANSFTLTSSTSNMVLDPNTGGSITITGGSKDKNFSFASATAGTFLTTGDKGIANGVASLGSDGKVPASQLAVGSISSESIVSICI